MAVTFYFNKSKIQIFKVFSDTLDYVIQMHSHAKNGYEIHLIDSGNGLLETPDNQYRLTKNTLYITGPNILHKQIPDADNPMHELCIYLKISPSSNEEIINYFISKPFWIGKSTASIRDIFRQIIKENQSENTWSETVLSSLAIRLIAEMSRLYSPEENSFHRLSSDNDLNESRSWILDQFLLDDGVNATLNDFAEKMGVCPRQAERIIKEHYNTSFKKLKYESRMSMAAALLEQKDISIEECAIRCGYSSASSFICAFKQKYKTTPKKYREEITNGQ